MSQEERDAAAGVKAAKVQQLKATPDEVLEAEFVGTAPHLPTEEMRAELPFRQIRVTRELSAALDAFRDASDRASRRLEGLTKWLIGFTVTLVILAIIAAVLTVGLLVLTGLLVLHDLAR